MTKTAIQKRFLLISVFLMSIALSVYRIFVIMGNMDISPTSEDKHYYLEDSMQTKLFAVLTVIFLLIIAMIAYYLGKRMKKEIVYGEPTVIFTSSLSGFLLIGAIFYYYFYFTDDQTSISFFTTAICVTALISSVYFLMGASKKAETNNKMLAWLSLAPIAFFALRLLNDFNMQSTTPDASSTPYLLISIIAFLLFFLAEGKFLSGTGNMTFYTLFGLSAILLSLIYSVPNILLVAFWVLPTDYSLLYSAIDLTLAMYISARIINLHTVDSESVKNIIIENKA